ncbi:MAG: hypothetical protein LBQ39_01975 [Tannerellaceae bacterium]|jgi:hypothetical protein|nr:hypothetical protein [Tannerellaceae bacterium]
MAIINPSNSLVTISGLDETATIIRPELMMLPLAYKGDEFNRMGVDIITGIQDKLRQYEYIRKGGLMRPYYPGFVADESAVGKMEQNELQVFLSAGIHKDNIQSYVQNKIGPMSLLGTNKTYKNPAERLILYSVMTTWSEDLLDAFFFARRNASGENKYDIFDGIYTQIQAKIADGSISEERRNLVPTGAIQPVDNDDVSTFYAVQEFLRKAHPVLTRTGAILNVTSTLFSWYQDAVAIKFKYTLTPDQYGTFAIPGFPNVRMYPNPTMGDGDLMILSKPKIMQLGCDTMSDDEYIKVRNIEDDANIVTYNIQARYGANLRSVDPKVFCINDGSLTSIQWAGDMQGMNVYTVKATAVANGTVEVSPAKDKYRADETVTITATPAGGYVFDKWSNGITTNPLTLKVLGNTTITATFKLSV